MWITHIYKFILYLLRSLTQDNNYYPYFMKIWNMISSKKHYLVTWHTLKKVLSLFLMKDRRFVLGH